MISFDYSDPAMMKAQQFDGSQVVAWKAWYESGAVFNSIDHRPADLPLTDIQVFKVFYLRPDDKRMQDGTKMLFHLFLTGYDQYPIPNSSVVVQGNWTTMVGHETISLLASQDRWPENAN